MKTQTKTPKIDDRRDSLGGMETACKAAASTPVAGKTSYVFATAHKLVEDPTGGVMAAISSSKSAKPIDGRGPQKPANGRGEPVVTHTPQSEIALRRQPPDDGPPASPDFAVGERVQLKSGLFGTIVSLDRDGLTAVVRTESGGVNVRADLSATRRAPQSILEVVRN